MWEIWKGCFTCKIGAYFREYFRQRPTGLCHWLMRRVMLGHDQQRYACHCFVFSVNILTLQWTLDERLSTLEFLQDSRVSRFRARIIFAAWFSNNFQTSFPLHVRHAHFSTSGCQCLVNMTLYIVEFKPENSSHVRIAISGRAVAFTGSCLVIKA